MQRYLETRTIVTTNTTVGTDLARHLITRQHLGKTVIVCDKPVVVISVMRKYWLRLSRSLQKERSSTLNVEKILQLTHDITHMQHMQFAAGTAGEYPQADVIFVRPELLDLLPANCFTLYLTARINPEPVLNAIQQLPEMSLVVDYTNSLAISSASLLPKRQLEQRVPERWRLVEKFFEQRGFRVDQLLNGSQQTVGFDTAVDILLSSSSQFMRVAADFLELLQLAQPLNVPSSQRQLYDMLAILNRRVCALTPGMLSQQFVHSLNDAEQRSLHDSAAEQWAEIFAPNFTTFAPPSSGTRHLRGSAKVVYF